MESVESITSADSNIYPEYLLPNFKPYLSDPVPFVRATYASCISSIGIFYHVF